MDKNESSISIINKNNGTLTGEQASALPIIIKTSFSWIKIFISGVLFCFVVLAALFFTAKTKVQTVEIVDRADKIQIMELK
jgi:hypothetical protein